LVLCFEFFDPDIWAYLPAYEKAGPVITEFFLGYVSKLWVKLILMNFNIFLQLPVAVN